MKFYFNKKHYFFIVSICFVVGVIGVIVALIVPKSNRLYWLFMMLAGLLFFGGRAVSERKTWVAFDENGVSAFRYGQKYSFRWDEIHRIEYKHAKWLPFNRAVIIHGFYGQDVYIDVAMENYKQIYKTLLEYIKKYAPPDICIDRDLFNYANGTYQTKE